LCASSYHLQSNAWTPQAFFNPADKGLTMLEAADWKLDAVRLNLIFTHCCLLMWQICQTSQYPKE
jgi:hypothetical protein